MNPREGYRYVRRMGSTSDAYCCGWYYCCCGVSRDEHHPLREAPALELFVKALYTGNCWAGGNACCITQSPRTPYILLVNTPPPVPLRTC